MVVNSARTAVYQPVPPLESACASVSQNVRTMALPSGVVMAYTPSNPGCSLRRGTTSCSNWARASSTDTRSVSISSSVCRAYTGHLRDELVDHPAVEHANDAVARAADRDVMGHDHERQTALLVQR